MLRSDLCDYSDVYIILKGTINLKLVSAIFYQNFIFSPNGSPSKTMKNIFYFI